MRLAALLLLFLLPGLSVRAEVFVLALSWQPQFCETAGRRKPECAVQRGQYFAQNLVLHGLWPQAGDYCGIPEEQRRDDKARRWENLPALDPQLVDSLKDVMPGSRSYLERHEWVKHGSCSGLDAANYYRNAADLVRQVNRLNLRQLIAEHAGGKISYADLCRTLIADFGATASHAISLKLTKSGDLEEIRIRLARTDRLELAPGRRDSLKCADQRDRVIGIDAAN
ncbi:hypothetical protein ACFSM5_14330 [Lacibacterium aquatile]|uniref:Uncharacterized protein n=1 Tax=Lacibacterium aquatile TaxID=1168082 RepID=A0ABW5DU78_9PROT